MKYLSATFLSLFIFVVMVSCAKRGTPTGGALDTIPPILVKSNPAAESINFEESKIKIYFDEYIKLKDVNKKLVISPPQKHEPVITPVGTPSKFISIKILDTLDPNTTYQFNFGNSIVDNNEENELGSYKYVFSTGTYIDSLNVKGEVIDPIYKDGVKNIDVMLYEYDSLFTDSVIYKVKPRYVANTLDSTLFDLTNLRDGKYLMIALKDANSNKMYNPNVDKIGFIKDTIVLPTDEYYNFTIFKEIPELKVIKPKEHSLGHLIIGYEGIASELSVELESPKPDEFKSVISYEKDRDTIHYWYTPFETDSLIFNFSKGSYTESHVVRIRSSKIDSLKVNKSSSGILHLKDTFAILSNNPIVNFDKSLIKIVDQDTVNVDFTPFLSKSKMELFLEFKKEHDSEYNFELLPKSITDIFGFSNDSLSFKLRTKNPEEYGIVNMEIVYSKKSAFIVELLNNKEEIIRIKKIDSAQMVNFNLLQPGNYLIRVTIDENNNEKWDTGSFLDKRQPEIIKYFDQIIELRANWDVNEIFNLDK